MSTHDLSGIPWAKLSELTKGSTVRLDTGFTCRGAGDVTVHRDEQGWFFTCANGKHYLDGQADDGEHCVGVYGPLR